MKFTKPTAPASAIQRPGQSPYDKAAEAAIEKKRSHYITLTCGHFTTWEADEFWSFNRPARNKSWCEPCGKWKKIKPRPKPKDYPNDPLF